METSSSNSIIEGLKFGSENEDLGSKRNNDDISFCKDEENLLSEEEEDEDDDDDKDRENILKALGECYSDSQNDLKDATDQRSGSPSGVKLPFHKISQENNKTLSVSLDFLNLNTHLSKFVVPETSTSSSTNASTCLFLNNIYQALLTEHLIKVKQKLAENQEKQKVLEEKIEQTYKLDTTKPRKNLFGIPYFNWKNTHPRPNEHTKVLEDWHYDSIERKKTWTNNDHELLIESVHENAWEITLKPFLQRIELYSFKLTKSDSAEEKESFDKKIKDIHLEMEVAQQQDINEILENIEDDKFDWMKISSMTFKGRHDEITCRLMWKNWLNPKLNKSPWSQSETKKLKELVEQYGRHQWITVAKELGTNRTPVHCLQHYRRKLDSQIKRDWTQEEDKILKEVIGACRIGDTIPWNQVSFYMEGRNSEDCIKRWAILNKTNKQGRWSTEEDSLLLTAIKMLGTTNWHQVKKLVPRRTAAQCRERWTYCLDPQIKVGDFTYDEDKVLLKFVQDHGPNWALVSAQLPGRTDAACRKQYEKLRNWKRQSNYILEQSEESKTFFIHDFDAKHFADLVEANKTLEELFPQFPNDNSLDIVWKNKQQILKRDLVRQELDRRSGDIYVPRPQLLRRDSNKRALIGLWEHRKKLRETIENLIEKQSVTKKRGRPKKRLKNLPTISQKLDNMKLNVSVSEMLEMARDISNDSKPDKATTNKKHFCSEVDHKIKNFLYVQWLQEEMKDQPKLTHNKSKASCEAEKYMDRLEGMLLIMKVLGADQKHIRQRILNNMSNGPMQSTSFLDPEELQNFKDEFLLMSQQPQPRYRNFSGQDTPRVKYSDSIPPNIHTLAAFRHLTLELEKLQKSADSFYQKGANSSSPNQKGANSSSPNQKGANSSSPNQKGANSSSPNQKGANSSSPNQKGANSSSPNQKGANSSSPNQKGANSSSPNQKGANSSSPNQKGANSSSPNQKGANSSSPNQKGANSSSPNQKGANSSSPNQKGANSSNPNQKGANSSSPNQKGANSSSPNQKGANSSSPNQKGANSSDPNCPVPASLNEKLKTIKHTGKYKTLQNHFYSLFMWPALLSSLRTENLEQNLGASKTFRQNKKKSRYPLSTKQTKFRKKKNLPNRSADANSGSKKQDEIPKTCEEPVSCSSELASTTVEEVPNKKRRGRPFGALTKRRKTEDLVPQRTSSRQKEKKARLDSEELANQPKPGTEIGSSNSSSNSQALNTINPELDNLLSKNKDLLVNVSPHLVQDVISKKVRVKPIGTYISIPLEDKNKKMPIQD